MTSYEIWDFLTIGKTIHPDLLGKEVLTAWLVVFGIVSGIQFLSGLLADYTGKDVLSRLNGSIYILPYLVLLLEFQDYPQIGLLIDCH
jgi:hypothetical protein